MTTELKKCKACQLPQNPRRFYRMPKTRDGLAYKCMTCFREEVRNRYYRRKQERAA